jgi:hypothetical protein
VFVLISEIVFFLSFFSVCSSVLDKERNIGVVCLPFFSVCLSVLDKERNIGVVFEEVSLQDFRTRAKHSLEPEKNN